MDSPVPCVDRSRCFAVFEKTTRVAEILVDRAPYFQFEYHYHTE